MKLVASMIVRNELGRYLEPCIEHLLAFCDEVRVVDDDSDDGTSEYLEGLDRVEVLRPTPALHMFQHEGRARQRLLEWVMEGKPTHVLSIDADEFVADGKKARAACESKVAVLTLVMEEVWRAGDKLQIREDGGWKAHSVPVLWRAPARLDRMWSIAPRRLACGREPQAVGRLARRGYNVAGAGTEILHFGWANEGDRRARYDRYVAVDNGRFHNKRHLDSIMWPDDRVTLRERAWPKLPAAVKRQILTRANLPTAATIHPDTASFVVPESSAAALAEAAERILRASEALMTLAPGTVGMLSDLAIAVRAYREGEE